MAEKRSNPYYMPMGVDFYMTDEKGNRRKITDQKAEQTQRDIEKDSSLPFGKSTKKNNEILQELNKKIRKEKDKPKMFKGGILNKTYGMKEGGFTKRGGMYKKGYIYSDD